MQRSMIHLVDVLHFSMLIAFVVNVSRAYQSCDFLIFEVIVVSTMSMRRKEASKPCDFILLEFLMLSIESMKH